MKTRDETNITKTMLLCGKLPVCSATEKLFNRYCTILFTCYHECISFL